MNLFRTLGGAAFLFLTGAGLNGCISAPDYPDKPSIEVDGVTVFRREGRLGLRDSVEIALKFRDGDGDLGLSNADTTGVYAYKGGTNRFNNNYFITPYYRQNGTGPFIPLPTSFSYNGRFLRLTDADAKAGPLRGVLRYAINFSLINPDTQIGTELKFDVSIADRALNESNVVTTDPVRL